MTRLHAHFLTALWLLAAPLAAVAQDNADAESHRSAPSVAAVQAITAIQIDGQLNDAAWAAAHPVTSFTQRDPDEGAPGSRSTEVRILYDDEALYIAARLEGPATYRLGRRDMALLDSDWFGMTVDSYHDLRTGFRFQVNPGGVQRDAAMQMGGGGEVEDLSWEAVWEVATAVTDAGWTVEMRIPFSQLRFSSASVQTWGLQLERIIGPRQEVSHWSFQPKGAPGGIPTYGLLMGLEGVQPGRRLEALPFVVARAEHVAPGANPFRSNREQSVSAGVDLRYRLTSHLTVNAAINPDFGQVEVDPAVVNLGVYETFFPEARPFFVEGRDIFRFTGNTSGGELFYSRRIGRRPQVGPPTQQADVPDFTRILGAAKLSGRTPDGWSIGVMSAITAEETGRFMDGGEAGSMTVEPLSNYALARVRRDVNAGRTSAGGIVTVVNRDLSTPALENTLHAGGYAGGLDFRHEFGERAWAVEGSVAASHVVGSAEAISRTQRLSNHYFQRPDATHLGVDTDATSLTGYSAGLSLARQSGRHWTGSLATAFTAPAFEVNDLGFQTRTDRRDLAGALTYSEREPGRVLRNWNSTLSFRHESNFDGDPVQKGLFWNMNARHLDYWGGNVLAFYRAEVLDDRSTRGGPLMIRPSTLQLAATFNSDARRSIVGSMNFNHQSSELGENGWGAGAAVAVRTSPRWNLSIGPLLTRSSISAQYLATIPDELASETFGQRYLFAPLDYTQLSANIRLNVALRPRLTLEVFAQPFIFASDFGDAMTLTAPRTYAFQPYQGALPALDRTIHSLRGNAVLRWEWNPGSTLYLAWQQSRFGENDTGEFSWAEDTRSIFESRPDNIFVLKVNYWLNP